MPLQNRIGTIIHSASTADVTGYTYFKVYASVAASPTINGVAVTIPAGATIDILVRSISPTANVFVIGDSANTTDPGGTTGKLL